jgi:hypothetical protein
MSAAIYNFTINQGETFTKSFAWANASEVPYNLTGWTARLQARAFVSSSSTLFDSGGASPTTGLSVTIPTPTNGTVVVTMTAAMTSAIPCDGVYALELTSGSGQVKRLIEGSFTISPETNR